MTGLGTWSDHTKNLGANWLHQKCGAHAQEQPFRIVSGLTASPTAPVLLEHFRRHRVMESPHHADRALGIKTAFEQHQTWVIQLLAWGKLLQQVTEHSGFCDGAAANRVTARLRHLEDKLALWHREMTPEEEDRILRAAFE